MPKLYFYDTGLLCDLLDIQSATQLTSHAHRGHIFENFVITEVIKNYYNKGLIPHVYFWRDKSGHEVDCIIEQSNNLIPIEIKSGKTITTDYFKSLSYWQNLSQTQDKLAYLIYAGDQNQIRQNISVNSWPNITTLLSKVI